MVAIEEIELIKVMLRLEVAARTGQGLVSDDLGEFMKRLRACESVWANRQSVARPLAAVLASFSSQILSSAELYNKPERDAIVEMGIVFEEELRTALDDGSFDWTNVEVP